MRYRGNYIRPDEWTNERTNGKTGQPKKITGGEGTINSTKK